MNADRPGRPSAAKNATAVTAGVDRHHRRQAAEAVDVAVVGAVVDHADQKEEHRRDRAVVEHLQHGAVDALLGERRHAEHDVAHVADGRVGDQLLEIGLRHRAEAP
jgi:hypothetical protein